MLVATCLWRHACGEMLVARCLWRDACGELLEFFSCRPLLVFISKLSSRRSLLISFPLLASRCSFLLCYVGEEALSAAEVEHACKQDEYGAAASDRD